MNKLLVILAALGAAVLQGCVSPKYNVGPEQAQWEESRFARALVRLSPVNRNTSIPGMSVRGFDLFISRGGFMRVLFPYLDSKWDLSYGDIVDIYLGPSLGEDWAQTARELSGREADEMWLTLPDNQRSQILGVVCRAEEDGCEYNSRHELAIGWGRKMRGADDYRGVAAEAKQRIYQPEIDRGGIKQILDLPGNIILGKVNSYTSSYVKKGLSADYEDPPEERQEHYENPCGGVHAYIGCKDAPFFSLEDE